MGVGDGESVREEARVGVGGRWIKEGVGEGRSAGRVGVGGVIKR